MLEDIAFHDEITARNYRFRPPYHPNFFNLLASELKLGNSQIALDLCAGTGEVAVGLAPYLSSISALDFSPPMLSRAKNHPKVRYAKVDVNEIAALQRVAPKGNALCTVGMGIHYLELQTLKFVNANLLNPSGYFVTLQSGFASENPWFSKYRTLRASLRKDLKGQQIDWVSREKVEGAGFTLLYPVVLEYHVQIKFEYLLRETLSMSGLRELNEDMLSGYKHALSAELAPYIKEGRLDTKIRNSAFVYRQVSR